MSEYLDVKNFLALANSTYKGRIFVVALTGGPCAGKTSLLNKFARATVSAEKLKVLVAQEAATFLKHSGINFKDAGGDATFQKLIIEQQLRAEAAAMITAIHFINQHPDWKVIILCDRGIMDGEAYFETPSEFEAVLQQYNLTREDVYARYHAVVCLRSAAVGAPAFYTTSDGTPRDEPIEEAAKLDNRVCDAWRNHPHYTEIGNSFKFYDKLEKGVGTILDFAGVELHKKVCLRYLVELPGLYELNAACTNLAVCTDKSFFLKQKMKCDTFVTVKVRMAGDNLTYYRNIQRWEMIEDPETGVKSEEAVYDTTFDITREEMTSSLLHVDSHIPSLEKAMYSFHLSEEIYCELDVYQCNNKNGYLRAYFDCAENEVNKYLPIVKNFITILKEVHFERKYSEYEIARTNGSVLNN